MLARIVFLFSLIVFLTGTVLLTMPVQFLSEQLAVKLPPKAVSLSGSLSTGQAQVNLADPSMALLSPLAINWQWCPGSGLSAWCIKAKSMATDIRIEGVASFWPNSMNISETKLIASLANTRILPEGMLAKIINAQVRGNIKEMSIAYDDFFPRDLDATLAINRFSFGDRELGNYKSVIRSDEQSTIRVRFQGRGGDITNLNAKISLSPLAKLNFGEAPKKGRIAYNYEVNINSDNAVLKGMLAIAGKRSSGGGYVLGSKGKW